MGVTRQPNFAALNSGRHLYSAGRPSRWALAHILVFRFLSRAARDTRTFRTELGRYDGKRTSVVIPIIMPSSLITVSACLYSLSRLLTVSIHGVYTYTSYYIGVHGLYIDYRNSSKNTAIKYVTQILGLHYLNYYHAIIIVFSVTLFVVSNTLCTNEQLDIAKFLDQTLDVGKQK